MADLGIGKAVQTLWDWYTDKNADLQAVCDGWPVEIEVDKEVCRSFYEYRISVAGEVTKVGAPGPDLTVSWTAGTGTSGAGNDYQVTVAAPLPANLGAWVEVEGDANTGTGAGLGANAVIPQNVSVTGNLIEFTLYSGDDGGAEDDARRRDAVLFISFDKEVVTDVRLV